MVCNLSLTAPAGQLRGKAGPRKGHNFHPAYTGLSRYVFGHTYFE